VATVIEAYALSPVAYALVNVNVIFEFAGIAPAVRTKLTDLVNVPPAEIGSDFDVRDDATSDRVKSVESTDQEARALSVMVV
jgi:hypothetical protein